MSLTFNHTTVTISTTNTSRPLTLNDTAGVVLPKTQLALSIDGSISFNTISNKLKYFNSTERVINNDEVIVGLTAYSNGKTNDAFNSIDDRITVLENASTFPRALITPWTHASIPNGWAICNGQTANGIRTPDLRDRFVVGARSTSTNGRNRGAYPATGTSNPSLKINDYGGRTTHQLTTAQIPDHKHVIPWGEAYRSSAAQPWGYYASGKYGSKAGQDSDNIWRYTSPVGDDKAHNNMPPFYALVFIMFVG